MGKMMFKNRPGGYITMPIVITKSKKLTIEEKAVLCYFMGYWMNNENKVFYLSYVSSDLNIPKESIMATIEKLTSLGIISVCNKRKTFQGETSFSLTMDSVKINSVFGCELITGNKPTGRTEPTVQPTPKKFTGKDEVVEDPLAWMNTEYFRKAREECQR